MNKLHKNMIVLTSLAVTSIFGSALLNDRKGHTKEIPYERPKGHEHKVRTEIEKIYKKSHKKSLKQRRNARKGIYEHKIKYPKKRNRL